MPLLLANGARKLKSTPLPRVWFLTDDARVPDVAAAVLKLPRGVGVILRHYGALDRAGLAHRLAEICRAHRHVFVVAHDWRLAVAVGADGLHLPEVAAARGLPCGALLWRKRRRAILTVSAHGAGGIARAHDMAADAALLAPIFPTSSHPGGKTLGMARARAIVRRTRLPIFAMGGLSPDMLMHARAAGFFGVAGIGFAVESKD